MSFQQGLSGLNAASKNLDAIGNNVANSNTVGFKGSNAVFADVYANSLAGAGANGIGIGVAVADVAQNFSQGNIAGSSNPLDMAINGAGFFRLSMGGTITYSRNGQFHLDKDGFIVNASGANLTGYQAINGVPGGVVTNLQITSNNGGFPQATTEAAIVANLNAELPVIAVPFDPADPATYSSTTSMTAYDDIGVPHTLALHYVKTADNTWQVYASNDNTQIDGDGATAGIQPLTTLTFTSGRISSSTPALPLTNIATANYTLARFDLSGTTQVASKFGVTDLRQDGFAPGRMTGLSIGEDGIIQTRYSNGRTETVGQIRLDDFANPNGLQPLGNNMYAETSESGQPVPGVPLSGRAGALKSGAIEESNVDLTAELVNMITAQRVYQANAQTIKTQDQVMQTLVNLR